PGAATAIRCSAEDLQHVNAVQPLRRDAAEGFAQPLELLLRRQEMAGLHALVEREVNPGARGQCRGAGDPGGTPLVSCPVDGYDRGHLGGHATTVAKAHRSVQSEVRIAIIALAD